ncbi:MAG: NAD+ synthase [Rhodospirillales bacterium]|nr:NAD+ synthase [Rhodospirillales bacterium]MCB9995424.1 NAD+ synthase [Rhodospirillales bacterium]
MAQDFLKIVSAQINTSVNNFQRNYQKIQDAYLMARAQGADLVVFPELTITGYPLEDSVRQPDILEQSQAVLAKLKEMTKQGDPAILVGLPQRMEGGRLFNTAVLLHKGVEKGMVRKIALPNYDVFDEKRNYQAGGETAPLSFKGHKLGVLICEDIWTPDVAAQLKRQDAEVLIAMNASPFQMGKLDTRLHDVVGKRVQETGLATLYVNQVGGQDEVVFDGASFAMNPDKTVPFLSRSFSEQIDMVVLKCGAREPARFAPAFRAHIPNVNNRDEMLEQVWNALVLGVRDYFDKEGFSQAILGMSGGIDSAVVAALAVDALGPENVSLYRLPSRFTSQMSNDDAGEAAKLMGCRIDTLPIADMHQAVRSTLQKRFDAALQEGRGHNVQVSDENIQSRLRGLALMTLSNLGEGLLLTTGNKSEISVGYYTLYGDSTGGFAPIRDVYKTMVYELAAWRNAFKPAGALGPDGPVMPRNIITRPPSAELAEDQKDTDSLPPYDILDPILQAFIEEDLSLAEIAEQTGQPQALVERIAHLVGNAEFKRRQAPLGPKISPRSFGKGWRQPLAQPTLPEALKPLDPEL